MGVDFYSCECCKNIFSDCGEYEYCECGKHWCDDECAINQGFSVAKCKIGLEISKDGYLEDDVEQCPKHKGSNENYPSCSGCKEYIPVSCSYCREENFTDSELLLKALKILNIRREDLVKVMNNK